MGNKPAVVFAVLIIPLFTLLAPPSMATAGNLLAKKGQQAILEYSIDIEGHAAGSNNNYQSKKWSTKRTLAAKAMLTASQPSAQDPGDPGGQHRASTRSNAGQKPSKETSAYMAELEKCGNDMSCRMRVSQKMQNDPKAMADMKKGAESGKGSPRYQMWTVERKSSVSGNVRMEVKTEDHFKTAEDELTNCTQTAEAPFETLISGSTWPAKIKIDAQAGTYAANIDVPTKSFPAKRDCVSKIGRERSERHEKSHARFLPEKSQKALLDEIEVFKGSTDAASGGKQLAHGEKTITADYGTLIGNVPMAAKITVRWTITLKD